MVSRKLDGAIIDCGGYNSLVNLAPSTANGQPVVHEQIPAIEYRDTWSLPQVTITGNATVEVGAGYAICSDVNNSNNRRAWYRYDGIANISASLPVGFSGSSAYVYLATNGNNDPPSDTAFISQQNPPNNVPAGYSFVRLLMPLFVESGVIRKGTHLPGLQRYNYDVDWSTPINPVTTAGGGLISVGVPVYPLTMSVFCSPGLFADVAVPTTLRFSRNSANTTPAISNGSPWESNFDGDVTSYRDINGYILTPWTGEIVTATAQIRALRYGNYIDSSKYPTFRISGYGVNNYALFF
jgi:hypothetical protein